MRQHSLSVENVASSHRQGQPPPLPFQRLLCLPNPSYQHSPQANISALSPAEAKPHPQAPYRRILARGQAGVMWQHSLSVENVVPSSHRGQPHPSLSKGFRAYRIPLVSIPRRRISVYFLPPGPNLIYRLPIGGYGKGTGWSHAATFIVGRKRCAFSSPRTAPSLPFQRLSCLSNPFCQHSP